jgi:beta-glucosidase
VLSAPGADPRNNDVSAIPAALKVAKGADVIVLMIGEDFDQSGESRSRSSLELPPSQMELARRVLALGKPVVVLLANGRPLAIQELTEKAAAIVETWMLGVEAGNAVADVLFGKYSPAGRLPAAFPRTTGAVPFNYSANATGRPGRSRPRAGHGALPRPAHHAAVPVRPRAVVQRFPLQRPGPEHADRGAG